MKRTALLAAVIAVLVFVLSSNFAPRAGASKSKGRAIEPAPPLSKSSEVAEKNKTEMSTLRRNKAGSLLADLGTSQTAGFTAGSSEEAEEEEEDNDPDRPPGFVGHFDEADYMRRREAYIALRRGIDPTKPLDPTARMRANAMMDVQVAELKSQVEKSRGTNHPLAFPNWVELGPNPIPLGQTTTTRVNVSGRISAIEIDPADPNKVYVGTAQGGIFRSLDGGTTWTPIFDSAQTLAIGTLNLDPVNGWLWVGTGEANGSADSFAGVGLYRIDNVNTTATLVGPINPIRNYNDAGGNPVSAGFFTGRSVSKILRVPGDPNTLFVGVAGGVIGLGGNPPFGNTLPPLAQRGLVRLSNVTGPAAGVTGTRLGISSVDTGQGLCAFDLPCTVNRNINDMVLDPQDPSGNTLVVWMNGINVANDGGIWRSTNAMSGAPTFTQTLVTTSTTTSNGRGELRTYVRGGATVMYVASGEPSNVPAGATICNNATQFGALRRSDDGGITWSAKLQGGGGFCQGQCFYNIGFDVLAGAATTTDKLLLGGNVASGNCARQQSTSLDGGATTFTSHAGTTHADTHVIKFAPSNPLVVYRGDDGGVWKSTDGGDTWLNQNNSTLRATQFQSISVHPTDPDISIGGTQDNGSNMLLTGGTTWLHSDDGDGGFAMIDQSTPTTMYHTYFNQAGTQIGYARSLTGGTFGSWSFLGCSGTGTTNGVSCAATVAVNFYCPTALGPGSPNNTVYIGTDRLLRSSTQGTANVAASQVPIQTGVPISAIGVSLLDDNYRIVGLNNGALWYTTTGSATLTSLDPVGGGSVIPDFYVGRLVFDPVNKNIVYIALGNFSNGTAPSQSHVWRITNLGTTPVITGINGSGLNSLPDVPVNGFAIDPQKPSRLFAGTDIGVFISEDSGASWIPYGQGLPRVAVFDMAIQNVKRVLRIATHGRGMWEIPIFAPTAAPVTIAGRITTPDGAALAGVTVNLAGARSAMTITDSNGNYHFNNLDTDNFYTVTPGLVNYHFGPESRSYSLLANQTDAVFTATRDAFVGGNAIDSTGFFVRQHYLDFLGREPDDDGFAFWTNQIMECGADAQCIERRTINVSAAYFLSIEFQQTGGLVDGLYRASYGRRPLYGEFMPDTGVVARNVVVGRADWAQTLEANKQAFVAAWIQRAEFRAAYDGLSNAGYVDALLGHTGVNFSQNERAALVSALTGGASTRADVLRQVVENDRFVSAKRNETFVMMQYFGYLRRDPDADGFQFWLNKLNQFNGNFEQAEMVKAFLVSGEYRSRF
jgi:hypothetical protein